MNLDLTPHQNTVARVIMDAGEHGITSLEIVQATGIVSFRQRISEMRALGCVIRADYDGRTESGASRFRYRWGMRQPVAGQQRLV